MAFAFAGGYLITALSYRALFLTASALTAAGTLLFGLYFRGRLDGSRLFPEG
ncbi:MAG: hypothetical protein JXA89_27960 [Anaerolineae bacterium]|nr:hypothetical protein [Anaerolineae bacterium]